MAMPKQGEMGCQNQDQHQDRRRGPESGTQRPDGSFLLDMERLSLLVDGGVNGSAVVETGAAANPGVPMFLQKTQSRKFSQRGDRKVAAIGDALLLPTTSGNGGGRGGAAPPSAAAAAPAPAAAAPDKFVTVALALAAAPEATATASPRQPAHCRRAQGRRAAASPSWLDPRWVFISFATLSSMGTIILIYFTLSMGKMGDGAANAR